MVKIRLTRGGAKKRPFYRVIAIDERDKRDGRAARVPRHLRPEEPSAAGQARRRERRGLGGARRPDVSTSVASLLKQARGAAKAGEGAA